MRWFLGAGVILLAAIILESSLLAYAMYVLLGLMLVSRLMARAWIAHIWAERECNTYTASIGDVIAVNISVHNDGTAPVPWVLMEDLLPRDAVGRKPRRLKVKGKRLQLSMMKKGGTVILRYQLMCMMRGYFQIGPLVLESGDLFGLHRRYRVGTEPHFLLVYPRVVPLEGWEIASRRPIGEIKMAHKLYEDPTRIAGVREYQTGDPLKRIHWGATARMGALHCKVYEPSTIAGATVLMDFHRDSYPSHGEPYRSELAVTAAASLVNAVYEMKQQIGLVTNGRDAADRIRLEGWESDFRSRNEAQQSGAMHDESARLKPIVVETRRGVEQMQRILETLARVELTDGLHFSELLEETGNRLPRDATVVVMLAHVTKETALAVGNLHRHGFAVTAILVMMNDDQVRDCHARLLAEGVRDVRHLADEASLPGLCSQQIMNIAPYQMNLDTSFKSDLGGWQKGYGTARGIGSGGDGGGSSQTGVTI